MTPEQLDEIEKLAEAATPGPWKFQRRNGVWAYAREDLVFMEAMREYALPLVKALREAWAEAERLRKLLNPSPKPDLGATLMRLMREDQRKEIYAQAWQKAILAGNTREQAHRIAADAVEAALKEEG